MLEKKIVAAKGRADGIDKMIGERIRARRSALGMSQTILGKSVKLTFQQIQKYESGVNRVSASTLLDIAEALGVDIGVFYKGLFNLNSQESGREGNSDETKKTDTQDDRERRSLLTLFKLIEKPHYRKHLLDLARILAAADSSAKVEAKLD
jgi:transcriptional regulator with XRE-family HTH domain